MLEETALQSLFFFSEQIEYWTSVTVRLCSNTELLNSVALGTMRQNAFFSTFFKQSNSNSVVQVGTELTV